MTLSLLLHWTSRTALFGDLLVFPAPDIWSRSILYQRLSTSGQTTSFGYYIFTISGVRLRPCQSRVDLFLLFIFIYVAWEACSFEASCFTVLIVQVLRSFGLTLRLVLSARFRTGYFYGTIIFGSVRTICSFTRTTVYLARVVE